jgi:predicted nucleotide-binding protein
MANKIADAPAYVEAKLKTGRDEFVQKLNEQIQKGEELLSIQVNTMNPQESYGGFITVNRIKKVSYNNEEERKFIEKYNVWHNYNKELYKNSFTAPNSTYRHEYESQGVHIIISDTIKEYKESIHRLINQMQSDIERIDLIPCVEKVENEIKNNPIVTMDVFVVHGHDDKIRIEVENFIRSIGYNPIILFKQADMGSTIIEKIERESQNVCFSIVIYTACDLGRDKNENDLKPRARQNVVFEHGYMCAKLGRGKVVALLENGVEQPGDLQGVVYKKLDGTGYWKYAIAKEMKAAGLQVDFDKIS